MGFQFSIDIQSHAAVIHFDGKIMSEIDLDQLHSDLEKIITNTTANLIFNLEKLNYINSTGINFFMKNLTKTRIHQGDLILANIQATVGNLFKITKLNEIYTIYPTLEEALNHFNK